MIYFKTDVVCARSKCPNTAKAIEEVKYKGRTYSVFVCRQHGEEIENERKKYGKE